MKLMWDIWYRSKGAKEHMPKKSFAGKNFGSIFWDAMRLVFYDEHNKPGLLYQGVLYPLAEKFIAANGGRRGFNEMDEIAMLKLGNFKYGIGLLPLRFEGPDKEDIGKAWGEAPINGSEVDVGFYDIVDTALNGTGLNLKFPQNEVGLRMITYFTGAVVLHEIMHNHGFRHPKAVDWNPGSVYASTLPHVALLAVLRASPEWSVFQPAIGAGFPTGGYPVLRHENSAAFTDDKSIWLEVVLQMRSIVLRGIHWRFLSCELTVFRRSISTQPATTTRPTVSMRFLTTPPAPATRLTVPLRSLATQPAPATLLTVPLRSLATQPAAATPSWGLWPVLVSRRQVTSPVSVRSSEAQM